FYSKTFEGRTTASGTKFSNSKFTAAHRSLSFGTQVKVTNLENNKSVVVTITDRGPFIADRIIDLSEAAAAALDFIDKGVVEVRLDVVSEE
ncbi:septal ring lytic transglycosylase RlpA family protein, partial [Robiginitalea sp.]